MWPSNHWDKTHSHASLLRLFVEASLTHLFRSFLNVPVFWAALPCGTMSDRKLPFTVCGIPSLLLCDFRGRVKRKDLGPVQLPSTHHPRAVIRPQAWPQAAGLLSVRLLLWRLATSPTLCVPGWEVWGGFFTVSQDCAGILRVRGLRLDSKAVQW